MWNGQHKFLLYVQLLSEANSWTRHRQKSPAVINNINDAPLRCTNSATEGPRSTVKIFLHQAWTRHLILQHVLKINMMSHNVIRHFKQDFATRTMKAGAAGSHLQNNSEAILWPKQVWFYQCIVSRILESSLITHLPKKSQSPKWHLTDWFTSTNKKIERIQNPAIGGILLNVWFYYCQQNETLPLTYWHLEMLRIVLQLSWADETPCYWSKIGLTQCFVI